MYRSFLHRYGIIVGLSAVCLLGGAFQSTSFANEEKSLYERLGGYDAISAVVDVFLVKIWDDPVVGRYFIGMGTDTRNQLRQKNKNLLCFNTGGPCKKINRPLETTHEGLGITDKEFDIVVKHIASTLKEFKVPQKEFDEVMAKVGGLRPYVVDKRIDGPSSKS
ncbi:group I truncated hemoglobin [Nitrospira sp. M1]